MGWHHIYHGAEEERRKWQNPESILEEMGLKQGQIFVDLGCGDGFFALPAAQIVGEAGIVYGVDIDSEAIKCLDEKAQKQGLTNMILAVAKAEDTVFCQACADFVFFGLVLHDFDDPSRVLENARRMINPKGLLADIDWLKEPMDIGPPLDIRFSENEAAKLIGDAGFTIESMKRSSEYDYVILARESRSKL